MTDQHRRKFDSTPEAIDQMILATENPKDRAMLMILSNVADRLVNHEENEVVMFKEAKRLMLIIGFFSNMILGMFLWYGEGRLQHLDALEGDVARHGMIIARMEERQIAHLQQDAKK